MGDTKRELADRQIIRKKFWTRLLDTARETTRLHSAISPGTETWVATGAGVSGLSFNYVATQHTSRVELYIDRGDEVVNEQTLEYFMSRREAIELAFGGPLDWQPMAGRKACRINYDVADLGYRDDDSWPELHAKMVDAMTRLEGAVRPSIAELR